MKSAKRPIVTNAANVLASGVIFAAMAANPVWGEVRSAEDKASTEANAHFATLAVPFVAGRYYRLELTANAEGAAQGKVKRSGYICVRGPEDIRTVMASSLPLVTMASSISEGMGATCQLNIRQEPSGVIIESACKWPPKSALKMQPPAGWTAPIKSQFIVSVATREGQEMRFSTAEFRTYHAGTKLIETSLVLIGPAGGPCLPNEPTVEGSG